MSNKIELHKTYTPHEWDTALKINSALFHALGDFKKHPLERSQRVPENATHDIYPEPYHLKDAELIEYIKPTMGIRLTGVGDYVLGQILQNRELCGNMLVINTIPFPEEFDIDSVKAVTMDAYKEAVRGN